MPSKQSSFTVIYSTCYHRVFCRASLTEHIPNVSHTTGTYQLDTDLPGTHVAPKECIRGHWGSYTSCSALFAGGNTRDTPAATITDMVLIEAWDIHTTMLTLCVRRGQKSNTPQDAVVPPYTSQTYSPCIDWRMILHSWISFKQCSLRGKFVFIEHTRYNPLNSESLRYLI